MSLDPAHRTTLPSTNQGGYVERVQCVTGAIIPTGVVSEGSVRAQDLATAALRVYEAVNPGGFVALTLEYAETIRTFAAAKAAEIIDGVDCEFTTWEWNELLHLTAEITEAINRALPEGWYYGSHDDDPACIGIWHT